jgi:hypothetical protein
MPHVDVVEDVSHLGCDSFQIGKQSIMLDRRLLHVVFGVK